MRFKRAVAYRSAPHHWAVYAVAVAVFWKVAFVAGQELKQPVFYSGGQAHQIIQSVGELVLEIDQSVTDTVVLATRAREASLGDVEEFAGVGPRANVRVMYVPSANPLARRRAATLPGVVAVRPMYRFARFGAPLIPTGRIVLQLVPSLSPGDIDNCFARHGVRVVHPLEGMDDVYIVEPLAGPEADDFAVAADLYNDPQTVFAHPDVILPVRTLQAAPVDPFFNLQWHLNNNGQGGATAGADINVLEAWQTTRGEDVIVGLLDDSADVGHEDLAPNYLGVSHDPATDEVSADAGNPQDIGDAHGTAVVGLICAKDNSLGVRGVAPAARWTSSRGLNVGLTAAQLASAYKRATELDVDVHNNSWGPAAPGPVPDVIVSAIRNAFLDGRDGKGMVVVFAAGNGGDDGIGDEVPFGFDFGTFPTAINVGASNANDRVTAYSDFGAFLDVLAPGGGEILGITTTDNTDGVFDDPGFNNSGQNNGIPDLPNASYSELFSGTSASAPIASGAAALILSVNPDLTAPQVRRILEHTADQVSPTNAGYDGVTGRSLRYGYGRINAGAAVQAAEESLNNGGLTWPERVGDVRVSGSTLSWRKNEDIRTDDAGNTFGDATTRVLLVQSANSFSWADGPVDGVIYDVGEEVVPGVTAVVNGDVESFDFSGLAGTSFFGIYAINAANRYSFGVAVDSDGNVSNASIIDVNTPGAPGDGNVVVVPPGNEVPKLSISVSPQSGPSPLTVTFEGNALTDSPITRAEWDFGDGTPRKSVGPGLAVPVSHTYVVQGGGGGTFTSTFEVEDSDGDIGQKKFNIAVLADTSGGGSSSGGGAPTDARIIIKAAGSNTEIDAGFATLDVVLSIDIGAGEATSVQWTPGDGGPTSTGFQRRYPYEDPGDWNVGAQIMWANGEVSNVNTLLTVCNACLHSFDRGTTGTCSADGGDCDGVAIPLDADNDCVPDACELVADDNENQNDNADGVVTTTATGGGGGSTCGLGMLPLFFGFCAFALLRRRFT